MCQAIHVAAGQADFYPGKFLPSFASASGRLSLYLTQDIPQPPV